MKRMGLFFGFHLILVTVFIFSYQEQLDQADLWRKKYFVICKSTPNYEEALHVAKDASRRLGLKLDLRGLAPNSETGLTFSEEDCNENFGSHPCYVARGRYDDGEYVSIEFSSAYKSFRGGFYIVMMASGSEENDAKRSLSKARKLFADSYIRISEVYMGCIH